MLLPEHWMLPVELVEAMVSIIKRFERGDDELCQYYSLLSWLIEHLRLSNPYLGGACWFMQPWRGWLSFLLDLKTDLSLNLAVSLLILTEGVFLTASGYYKQKLRRKRMRLTVSLRIFHWKGGCLSLLPSQWFPHYSNNPNSLFIDFKQRKYIINSFCLKLVFMPFNSFFFLFSNTFAGALIVAGEAGGSNGAEYNRTAWKRRWWFLPIFIPFCAD